MYVRRVHKGIWILFDRDLCIVDGDPGIQLFSK